MTGLAPTRLAPHLTHISAIALVDAPQAGQKELPFAGLAPQCIQISGFPTSSLPQFLQYDVALDGAGVDEGVDDGVVVIYFLLSK
jgi:hypothetical protein